MSRGAEAQSVTVKSTGCGFNPHSELFIFIFSFLCSGVGGFVRYSAESGKRSVIRLGSLYLLCCVRDTA